MKELAAIAAIGFAIIVLIIIFPWARQLILPYIAIPLITGGIVAIVVFVLAFGLGKLIAKPLEIRVAAAEVLTRTDKLLGICFGIVRVWLLAGLVYVIMIGILPISIEHRVFKNFQSRPMLKAGLLAVQYSFPNQTKDAIAEEFKAAKDIYKDAVGFLKTAASQESKDEKDTDSQSTEASKN